MPEAGRLQFCSQNWRLITEDPWILQIVAGYQLELEATPHQRVAPRQVEVQGEMGQLIEHEIQKLQQKQAVTHNEVNS